MSTLRIMVSRHSAFYSPLIGAIAGGFLKGEGFEPTYAVASGTPVTQLIAQGEIDVAQSAVSGSWAPLEKGQKPPTVHFAQINERDGFFINSRQPDSSFSWSKLAGKEVIFVHGGQPQAMFVYALHKKGVEFSKIKAINEGTTDKMIASYRAGKGDYFHEQGPYPQQLEADGVGKVVASVGEAIGEVAFSSLTSTREWLAKPEAKRFMRAYRKSRNWVNQASAEEIAKAEKSFFPEYSERVLADTIRTYQKLGCWNPNPVITQKAYDAALDVFLHSKLITKRHPMSEVVVAPPDA